MKKLYIYIFILLFIVAIVSTHIYKINSLVDNINSLIEQVNMAYQEEEWGEVSNKLEDIKNIWMENRLWASSTISTKEIDEIEISLEQTIEYAKLASKENFIGEFGMFRLCIEHIPMQEGLSLHELL